MSLTDVMSGANLALLPTIGLVIFLGVFAAVIFRVFSKGQKAAQSEASMLPLTDDVPLTDAGTSSRTNTRPRIHTEVP